MSTTEKKFIASLPKSEQAAYTSLLPFEKALFMTYKSNRSDGTVAHFLMLRNHAITRFNNKPTPPRKELPNGQISHEEISPDESLELLEQNKF